MDASQNKERPVANANFKLQLITPNGKWPYLGNAYLNRDGSFSICLDAGVTITGGQKLHLRAARAKPDKTVAPQPER